MPAALIQAISADEELLNQHLVHFTHISPLLHCLHKPRIAKSRHPG
jgi:hypothetical protein